MDYDSADCGRRLVVPWLLAGAQILTPNLVHAQDTAAKAQSVRLFDDADKLMMQGNTAAACAKYAASMQLDPQLGALLHLADCYVKNGQVASAWGSFREAEEMARMKGDERESLAREQAAQLEPRLSHLTVVVPDSSIIMGLDIRLDGTPIAPGAWGTAAPMDAGVHRLDVRAPGHQSWSSTVEVAGDAKIVRVEVPRLMEIAPTAPPLQPGPTPMRERIHDGGSALSILGWAGIGVGAASLGLGAAFWVQKNSKVKERDGICEECTQAQLDHQDSLTSDAKTANSVATAGFIVGGTLVAAGVAAVIFAPASKPRTKTVWLLPRVTPRAVGLNGGLTW